MDDTGTEVADWGEHPTADGPFPEFVDWLLGAVIALAGMISVVGGSALVFLVDREGLASAIEEEVVMVTVGARELTDDEALEVADAVVAWVGTGLLLIGTAMVLFAVAYVGLRHRAHRRFRDGEAVRSFGTYAILGAIATVVLSFVPISPILGGALAGYLERAESERTVSVGALAGLLPVLPLLAFLTFVLGGIVSGMLAIDQGGMAIVAGAALCFALMLIATLGAGLGALGGYLGGMFAEGRATVE